MAMGQVSVFINIIYTAEFQVVISTLMAQLQVEILFTKQFLKLGKVIY